MDNGVKIMSVMVNIFCLLEEKILLVMWEDDLPTRG